MQNEKQNTAEDMIIFKMKRKVCQDTALRIKERCEALFPGCKGIILEDETDIEIIRFGGQLAVNFNPEERIKR